MLLGESVLQLITSEMPNKESHPGMSDREELEVQEKFAGMQFCGFILTLTVMHSFTIQEPPAHAHVMHHGSRWRASLWLICFLVKSLAVWLVGIGIKIALYDPVQPVLQHSPPAIHGGHPHAKPSRCWHGLPKQPPNGRRWRLEMPSSPMSSDCSSARLVPFATPSAAS